MSNPSMLLSGLDGSNPLAFLAALGTLRTLSLALPGDRVAMSWEQYEGAWRPRMFCQLDGDGDAFIDAIDTELRKGANRASFAIGDNLNLPAEEFREHLREAVDRLQSASRIDIDFLAAFGSEVVTDDKGKMADTALRTMSGAGHQHFLKFLRELIANTDAGHLHRALLLPWDYADEGRGMNLRWDPADDRRYALRWDDPGTDPNKTMRGANRLAIEAMPLLPTMPVTQGLATTAFEGRGARDTYFTWPIWTSPIVLDVVRSLLGSVINFKRYPGAGEPLGVPILFTSARITTGKFRNFTPGVPVSRALLL